MTKGLRLALCYFVTIVVCLLMAWGYLAGREYSAGSFLEALIGYMDGTGSAESNLELVRFVGDAAFIPGVLSVMAGLLVVVSNEGAFYGVAYAVTVAAKVLLPGGRKNMETYADYITRKTGKKATGFGFLFVVGGVFVLIGLLFGIRFYTMA